MLSEAAASRLLARASELEASGKSGFTVAELRAAAMEAGIPEHAFEAALSESRRVEPQAVAPPTRHRSRRYSLKVGLAGVGAGLVALLFTFFAVRMVVPAPTVVTSTEAIMLRCLTPGQAAELIRPLIRDAATTVVINEAQAPRVITIRGTSDAVARAKAAIEKHEGSAPSCASQPLPD